MYIYEHQNSASDLHIGAKINKVFILFRNSIQFHSILELFFSSGVDKSGPSKNDLVTAVIISSASSFVVALSFTQLLLLCRVRCTRNKYNVCNHVVPGKLANSAQLFKLTVIVVWIVLGCFTCHVLSFFAFIVRVGCCWTRE